MRKDRNSLTGRFDNIWRHCTWRNVLHLTPVTRIGSEVVIEERK